MQQIWIQMCHSGWSREDSLDSHSFRLDSPPGCCMWSRPKGRMDLLEVCITLLLYCAWCSITVQGMEEVGDRDRGGLAKSLYPGEEIVVGFDEESRSLLSSHRRHTRAIDNPPIDRRKISVGDQPPLLPNGHRKSLYKRETPTSSPNSHDDDAALLELARIDPEFASLQFIENIRKEEGCTETKTLAHFNHSLEHSSFDKFKAQTLSVIRYANVLNSLFRNTDQADSNSSYIYNKEFYKYWLRALLESDPSLFGATIAFDAGQFNNGAYSPSLIRNKNDGWKIQERDLASDAQGAYATQKKPGYDWFWKQRDTNFSDILFPHIALCKRPESNDLSAPDSRSKLNATNVVTTIKQGIWSVPYYSCSHGASWIVTYSAPFFGCRKWKGKDNKTIDGLHFK